ncbi:MAG TPA: transport protein RbsD/FucU [Verrucomicrobiales bacterium]|nr:transport protein RbsD/FucU [Verrucomicrobiales bacterium]
MLQSGILNPALLSLVGRVRHTNTIVVADHAFPSWPGLETVDLSLVVGVPSVLQVLGALLPNWKCGAVWMAEEFRRHNDRRTVNAFRRACRGVRIQFEPHLEFKRRVPNAIGLVRTGDGTIYSNIILESA